MKKIFILFVLFFGMFFLPKTVFADSPELLVYTDNGSFNLLKGQIPDHVSFDENTNTLTLNGFEGSGITSSYTDLTIVLEGENSISSDSASHLFYVDEGSLTIMGDGTLNLLSNSLIDGIFVYDGDLIINSGTINISVGSVGIYVAGETIINGGEMNIDNCDDAIVLHLDSNNKSRFTINDGIININSCAFGIMFGFGPKDGVGSIVAKGGTINIKQALAGFLLAGDFLLDGTNIVIEDSVAGITSMYILKTGRLVFNKGNYSFSSQLDYDYIVPIEMGFYAEDVEKDSLFYFNEDNLYFENPLFEFIIIDGFKDETPIYNLYAAEKDYTDEEYKLVRTFAIRSKKEYEITEGNKQRIFQTAKDIRINADLDKFVALYINDELVDEKNYELESGSTIIKLKDDYIKNLDLGEYTFKAVFTDGNAEGTFVITDEEESVPEDDSAEKTETGDSVLYSVLLLFLSMGSLVMVKKHA